MNAPQKSIHYEQYEFQKWKSFDAETIVEMPVSLTVNGEVWISFMCTPVNLEALAFGLYRWRNRGGSPCEAECLFKREQAQGRA